MSDFGRSTETTGGTRFSEGKVVLTWLPWRGIYRAYQDREMASYLRNRHDVSLWEEMVLRADVDLAHAMNVGTGWEARAASSLYWLLQICHAAEVHRGQDADPQGSIPFVTLIPALGVWEIGRVSCYGAHKYAEFDWDEGQSFSTLLSSARRHVDKMLAFGPFSVDSWHGDEPKDTEYSGLMHAGHAAWNIACLLDFLEQGRRDELDDVSVWRGITADEKQRILSSAKHQYAGAVPAWKIVRDHQKDTLAELDDPVKLSTDDDIRPNDHRDCGDPHCCA